MFRRNMQQITSLLTPSTRKEPHVKRESVTRNQSSLTINLTSFNFPLSAHNPFIPVYPGDYIVKSVSGVKIWADTNDQIMLKTKQISLK